MRYKTIDLCAGIGGIRKGFELAGEITNVASAEIDEWACKTYERLFHENPRNDVTDLNFKEKLKSLNYDFLLAGFPCQAFSSAGLRQGFEDKTKGTIFFDIATIIKMTKPKVIFLENVQNLLSHDNKTTFKTIIDTLDRQLNYHIVGVNYDENGELKAVQEAFVRNSKNFGVPQNRPRVYIIGFNRDYFGNHLSIVPNQMPMYREKEDIFYDLNDILEDSVEPKYFLSSGYLETLEKHVERQQKCGNGFGYRIVNSPDIERPIANTILATGGSGKERNLILDEKNGLRYGGLLVKGKQSPINNKNIRMMTPNEWGRLQGFIGYAFLEEDKETFSFPENTPLSQQYKQFGNSVTIPAIEEMARFIFENLELMYREFSSIEKRLYTMYGEEFEMCNAIVKKLGNTLRDTSINQLFDAICYFKFSSFRAKDLAILLKVTAARSSQILGQLLSAGCVEKDSDGLYHFCI